MAEDDKKTDDDDDAGGDAVTKDTVRDWIDERLEEVFGPDKGAGDGGDGAKTDDDKGGDDKTPTSPRDVEAMTKDQVASLIESVLEDKAHRADHDSMRTPKHPEAEKVPETVRGLRKALQRAMWPKDKVS